MRHAVRFGGRVSTFGLDRPADIQALNVRDLGVDGTAALVRTPAGEAELRTGLPGTANLSNLLAATAVAVRFGVPLSEIVARAAALRPLSRRGEITKAGGVTIVDDSYNSNPRALSKALSTVAGEGRFARRVALIGEMLELGEASEAFHRAAGEEAARSGLAVLVAVGGPSARALADGAVHGGMSSSAVHYLPDSDSAAEFAVTAIKSGDLVLVKGSRGIRMDVVVDRLKAELA
jgi:UDP-N-acetylmuramoyl-tripeptide--D-alanyl-D-alanine ligase